MRIVHLVASLAIAGGCIGQALAADAPGIPNLPQKGRWSVTPELGTAFTLGGEFVKSASTSGAVNIGASTVSVAASAKSHSFSDVYDVPVVMGFRVNYGLTNREDVSLGFRYLHAAANRFDALSLSVAGTVAGTSIAANVPIQGQFSDYNEYGIEASYRYFFPIKRLPTFHPYVVSLLGAKRTDNVSLNLSYNGAPLINGIHFYKAGWSLSGGMGVGFRWDVSKSVALGLETGFRYEGTLDRDNSDLAVAGGLSKANQGGERWDFPVTAGLTIRF